jgi:hypothetical protein
LELVRQNHQHRIFLHGACLFALASAEHGASLAAIAGFGSCFTRLLPRMSWGWHCHGVRAATTKNGKAAPIPIDDELAGALRELRGAGVQASGKVFESLPRIACFRADLAKAEIEPVNASGERIDFHALRMTFQMRLTLNGVSPRVTMEAMRHSDMKLTAKIYTDAGMLPTREAVCSLPPLLNCTPIRTPDLGANGHSVSPADTSFETLNDAGTRMDTGFRHDSAQLGTMSHETGDGARCRVRTCDFVG